MWFKTYSQQDSKHFLFFFCNYEFCSVQRVLSKIPIGPKRHGIGPFVSSEASKSLARCGACMCVWDPNNFDMILFHLSSNDKGKKSLTIIEIGFALFSSSIKQKTCWSLVIFPSQARRKLPGCLVDWSGNPPRQDNGRSAPSRFFGKGLTQSNAGKVCQLCDEPI